MKIGIITHYYNSENYGGNLQAYALCRAIKSLGHNAEQICYNRLAKESLKVKLARAYYSVLEKIDFRNAMNKIRKKSILQFNQAFIPHSDIVYDSANIKKSIDKYDAFITGSDQVWHPDAICDAYLLSFVPSTKIKLSYAASIAKDSLTEEQKKRFEKALYDFRAVSVREEKAIDLLNDISPKDVELTLDPTLLLSKEQWLEIADNYYENKIEGDYLFCYFLGSNENQRKLAMEYAKKHNLKIVNLPHLLGKYRKCDKDFGDYQLYDVTPNMLISLIKNAECIFTDSFHATVFSLLLEKEHFVFERNASSTMNSRIYNLISIFDTNDRFCDSKEKETISYIDKCARIDYSKQFVKFNELKNKSIHFLKMNLQ